MDGFYELAQLTRRQRIRIRSYIHLAVILLIAVGIIVGSVLLARRIIGSAGGGKDVRVSGAYETAEEETAAETPVPTTAPVPMPPLPEVDTSSWELRYVSSKEHLPSDYEPELMEIENNQYFDARAGMHLQKLIEDARAAGYSVFVCSGYRSYDTQHLIYWNHVTQYESEGMTREEAEAATLLEVNYPGGSEHQLGLAADILEFQGQEMEPWIGGSGLMLWLEEHCADYGFVVRYPEGKTDITGVEYEPWHLRFVGSCARYLTENDLCLEEFLALYQ